MQVLDDVVGEKSFLTIGWITTDKIYKNFKELQLEQKNYNSKLYREKIKENYNRSQERTISKRTIERASEKMVISFAEQGLDLWKGSREK